MIAQGACRLNAHMQARIELWGEDILNTVTYSRCPHHPYLLCLIMQPWAMQQFSAFEPDLDLKGTKQSNRKQKHM